MPTVSTKWDIVSLIEHHANIQLVGKPRNVRGALEYHSNCPWCPGSDDSFGMIPSEGRYSHALRDKGCGRHGDALDFLKEYVHMTHQEAVEELGLESTQFADEKPVTRAINSDDTAPPVKWSEAAELLLVRAERYFWSDKPDAVQAREYLHSRGLRDEILKKKRVGYVPLQADGSWYRGSFEDWGLDPEALPESQRAKGGINVPDCILIAHFVGGVIWMLEAIRPWAERMPKGQVMGSVACLYNVNNLQYGDICMMLESTIDALSVEQEAGDLVTPVSTGGTPKCRASRWITELMMAVFVLQCFDSDEAGDKAALAWIDLLMARPGSKIETSSFDRYVECKSCERWPLILWKDPNELLQAQLKNETDGFTLRDWVQLGVDIAQNTMQQDMNPLAREVQEESVRGPEQDRDYLSDVEESEAPLPDPQDEKLLQYATVVSQIVDVFASTGEVTITKHDGRSLDVTYPTVARPYEPVTLPPLPRTKCPHGNVTEKRVSDEMSNGKAGRGCIGKPLANGWCADHQGSQALLDLGARLGYPEIMDLGKFRARGILQGIACWEVAAEHYGIEHIALDIRQIKAKFGV